MEASIVLIAQAQNNNWTASDGGSTATQNREQHPLTAAVHNFDSLA